MEKFNLVKVNPSSEIPYGLLLLADETVEAINRYIFNCDIYLLQYRMLDIAVMALYPNSIRELEIKNIAVLDNYRSRGIGAILIDKAKQIAKENGYKILTVGTSDTCFQQIRFYEKNGFIKNGMRKDFFIDNYPLAIYENGLQMRDMLIFTHDLSK